MSDKHPFGYCLNTSTIRGQGHSLMENIRIAAEAGYTAIEPWIREMDEHVKAGGSLKELEKAIRDHGLSVPNVIGFFEWAVEDETVRVKGIEEAKRNLDMVAQIGAKRLAAPPFGAHAGGHLDLLRTAERYRELMALGEQHGVIPMVEFWGPSKNLNHLGEAMLVAIESGHPKACILADVYHMYKGGSDPRGLRLIRGETIGLFHMNDYPPNPPRATITDADRVYPGDGQANLSELFRTLRDIGYRGQLSLELFNASYYAQDARAVVRTGLQKMQAAVEKALS